MLYCNEMKIIFYQANFCAECGNAMKPRFSLGPRYFCDECRSRTARRNYFKSVAGLLLCATLAVFAFNRTPPPNITSQAGVSAVSAFDTVTDRNPEPKPVNPGVETRNSASPRVMCGARTKKGKPCRRLVTPGHRCAQHRGMASLLEARAPRAAPAMTNDKRKMTNGN
jgi:hypothetical protein